MSIFVNPVI